MSVIYGEMNNHSFILDEMEVQDSATSAFLNLPNEMQVAIIDKVIEDGLDETTVKTLQLVCKGLREIAATSVGAFLKSLCTSVSDGILHAKLFSILIPDEEEVYGEEKYVWKHLRKTMQFIRAHLSKINSEVKVFENPDILSTIDISPNHLNVLQESIHSKLNHHSLKSIWVDSLRDRLVRLPQTQPFVKIPEVFAPIQICRDFLNDANNINFLFQLKKSQFILNRQFFLRPCGIIPPEIEKLTGLQKIRTSFSRVRFVPDTIGNLKELNSLVLSNNPLRALPATIGNLSNLEKLIVERTYLRILPDTIGNLQNLKVLSIRFNQLTALPGTIGNLINLERLYVDDNKLRTLPDAIGDSQYLKSFSARRNPLEEIPHKIAQWKEALWEEMKAEGTWEKMKAEGKKHFLYMPFETTSNTLRLIPDNLLIEPEKLFILVPRPQLLDYADQASERLHSPLARLYQLLVLKAASLQPESAKDFFYGHVPLAERRAIFEMFLECAGHLLPNDQQLQEHLLFDETIHRQWTEQYGVNDPGLFFAAVRGAILKQLSEIPQDKKQRFYELVTEVAGKSNSDPEWGERKAEHYLAFAAEALDLLHN